MRTLPALALVIVAAGCRPLPPAQIEDTTPPPAPVVELEPAPTSLKAAQLREGPVAGYVALIATQPLFGANDLANSVGSVVAVDSSSDVDDQGQSLVFSWRVLEDRGDFIAVESLEEAERNQQCLREDNLFFHRYRLRALVPRDGLVPVTHVESEVRFGDGSMIRAGAGLQVDFAGGRTWLRAEGLEQAVPFEREVLGASWTKAGLSQLPGGEGITADPAPMDLQLDGKTIDLDQLSYPLAVPRSLRIIDDSRQLAAWQFSSDCVALELVGPAPRSSTVTEVYGLGHGFGAGFGGGGATGAGSSFAKRSLSFDHRLTARPGAAAERRQRSTARRPGTAGCADPPAALRDSRACAR